MDLLNRTWQFDPIENNLVYSRQFSPLKMV